MKCLLQDAANSRNYNLTYGGVTPIEMAIGRRPPDIIQTENMDVAQLHTDAPYGEPLLELRMRLATEAHMKARQRLDLRRDLSAKLLQSHTGVLQVGQNIWYWDRDMTKIRGGEWLRGKVLEFDPKNPMVKIELNEDHKGRRQFWCNRSKVKRNPDPWHDVMIPGLEGRDGVTEVPPPENLEWEEKVRVTVLMII